MTQEEVKEIISNGFKDGGVSIEDALVLLKTFSNENGNTDLYTETKKEAFNKLSNTYISKALFGGIDEYGEYYDGFNWSALEAFLKNINWKYYDTRNTDNGMEPKLTSLSETPDIARYNAISLAQETLKDVIYKYIDYKAGIITEITDVYTKHSAGVFTIEALLKEDGGIIMEIQFNPDSVTAFIDNPDELANLLK